MEWKKSLTLLYSEEKLWEKWEFCIKFMTMYEIIKEILWPYNLIYSKYLLISILHICIYFSH